MLTKIDSTTASNIFRSRDLHWPWQADAVPAQLKFGDKSQPLAAFKDLDKVSSDKATQKEHKLYDTPTIMAEILVISTCKPNYRMYNPTYNQL